MQKPKENKMIKAGELKNLMGNTDVANYLGWHRAHVHSYRKRKESGALRDVDFPEPTFYVGNRAMWEKKCIKHWAKNNEDKLKKEYTNNLGEQDIAGYFKEKQ